MNNVEGNFEWLPPQNCYPLRPKAIINWDHFLLFIFLKSKMGDGLFGAPSPNPLPKTNFPYNVNIIIKNIYIYIFKIISKIGGKFCKFPYKFAAFNA